MEQGAAGCRPPSNLSDRLATSVHRAARAGPGRPFQRGYGLPLAAPRTRARAATGSACTITSDPLRRALARGFPNAVLLDTTPLPDLTRSVHLVNLTNGIEALPTLERLCLPYAFSRITSTACEQQAFERLASELDANLLTHLALGHTVLVWDCGSRHLRSGAPRALWMGLEFVRWALLRLWAPGTAPSPQAHVRGHRVTPLFEARLRDLTPGTLRRLKYYRRYVRQRSDPSASGDAPHAHSRTDGGASATAAAGGSGGSAASLAADAGGVTTASGAVGLRVHLYGVFRPTAHDSDAAYHAALLHRHCCPGAAAQASAPLLPMHASSAPTTPDVQETGALAAAATTTTSASAGGCAIDAARVEGAGTDTTPTRDAGAADASNAAPDDVHSSSGSSDQWRLRLLSSQAQVSHAAAHEAYKQLVREGYGLFLGGLSHTDFRMMAAQGVSGSDYRTRHDTSCAGRQPPKARASARDRQARLGVPQGQSGDGGTA